MSGLVRFAACRSRAEPSVVDEPSADGESIGNTIKPPGTRSIERNIGICFMAREIKRRLISRIAAGLL